MYEEEAKEELVNYSMQPITTSSLETAAICLLRTKGLVVSLYEALIYF